MNVRWTAALVVGAAALGAWVWFGELGGESRKKAAEAEAQRVFGEDPNGVTKLEVSLADGTLARLVRAGTSWQLELPVVYPADPESVERLLHSLQKVQATATISPAPAELAQFGLGESRRTVRLFAGDAPPKEVFLGAPTPIGGGRYLALPTDPNKLYVVDSAEVSGALPTLVDLRDKRLLRLPTDAADELTVRADGALVAHAKKTEAGWQLVEPEAAPADAEKLRRVLEDVGFARATGFADTETEAQKASFQKPELQLDVHSPAGEERVAFAKADGKTWLSRAGDAVLLEVNPAVSTGVPTKTFDYRQKRVLTLASDQVHALELSFPRTGETHRFELDASGSEWKSTEAGVELKPLKVEDLVLAVASLDATGLEPAGADRKKLGLDPPMATVRALDAKGAELGVLSLGDASPREGLPALSSQNSEVWRVSNDLGGQVPLSPEAYRNLFVKSAAPAPAPPPKP